jgi:hypothetical protein
MIRTRLKNKKIALHILASVILLTACGKKSMEGIIIITEGGTNPRIPDYITGDSWRYIPQSRLIAVDPDRPDKSPEILTTDFFSARSPEISCDGTHMLFAAQMKMTDPWQIWEMELGTSDARQITTSSDNSIDPAYLPGGKIVFSRSIQNDSLKAGHTLFTCNLDGTDIRRITFNPHSYFASSVLKDGRVLAISRQVFPIQGEPSIMVLRPDGTKAELFYKGEEGNELSSRSWETENGKIVFIESEKKGSSGGRIVAINYNRPLHSRIDLSSSVSGDYHSVYPMESGKLLVSFRETDKDYYSLYEFDAEKMILGEKVYMGSDGDVLEAVSVKVHERPKKLPSEVDPGVKTGLLLCQNINVTGMNSPSGKYSLPAADRIEIIGIDSSLGIVQVEKDGSFYIKVAADIPFRIRTLDTIGNTVNGPGSWYWLRPNERRGCVGCHEDNETAPANRYAMAVSKQPVAVPVHVTGIIEKEVELE